MLVKVKSARPDSSSKKRAKEKCRPSEERKKSGGKEEAKKVQRDKRDKEKGRSVEARKKPSKGAGDDSKRGKEKGKPGRPDGHRISATEIGIVGMGATLIWDSFNNMFPSLPPAITTAGMGAVGSIGILQAVRSNMENRRKKRKKGKGEK